MHWYAKLNSKVIKMTQVCTSSRIGMYKKLIVLFAVRNSVCLLFDVSKWSTCSIQCNTKFVFHNYNFCIIFTCYPLNFKNNNLK